MEAARRDVVVVAAQRGSDWTMWVARTAEEFGWRLADEVAIEGLTGSDLRQLPSLLADTGSILILLTPRLVGSPAAPALAEAVRAARSRGVAVAAVAVEPSDWWSLKVVGESEVFGPSGKNLKDLMRSEQNGVLRAAFEHLASIRAGPQSESPAQHGPPPAEQKLGASAALGVTASATVRVYSHPVLPGYDADDVAGPDRLGITPEVNALAALAAAWTVEPPLSIGLFGDWGSGKSFFMRKMRSRIEVLSEAARASGKPQRDVAYYKNVVQIEFNAWHYMEANLWASLVDHIFSNLRLHPDEPEEDVRKRKQKLLHDLKIEEEVKARREAEEKDLRVAVATAERRADAAKEKIDEKRDERRKALAKDFAREVALALPLKQWEQDALEKVNLGLDPKATAEEVAKLLERARGIRADARRVMGFAALNDRKGLALAAAGIASLVGLGVAVLLESSTTLNFDVVGRGAAAGLAAAGGVLTQAQVLVGRASEAVRVLEARHRELADVVNLKEQERQREVAEIDRQVADLRAQAEAAAREKEEAERRIRRIHEELEQLDPARILAEFIQDRAESEDYRKHLGVVALIRRDFERLARLFEAQRRAEREGSELAVAEDDPYRINRIVLYVDDLDRCPPNKVVEVLQAIHLLLAFPLFVVVVGVDSRWVSRSLMERYDLLLEEGESEEDSAGRPGATPRDYLEKIFQIPFWLRPLDVSGTRALLVGATRDALAAAPEPATAPVTPTSGAVGASAVGAGSVGGSETGAVVGTAAPAPAPKAAQRVELTLSSLTLSPEEVEAMQAIAQVIGRSPRTVKRFINCYRLLKVGLPADDAARLVDEDGGGHFRATLLLLGIVVAAPEVADDVVLAVERSAPSGSLRGVLDELGESEVVAREHVWAIVRGAIEEHARVEGWGSEALARLRWAVPRVRRFSFGLPREVASVERTLTPAARERAEQPVRRA